MTIAAIISILMGEDSKRDICVKEGPPMEIAYSDDNGKNWAIVNFGDTEQYLPSHHCLMVVKRDLIFLATSTGKIYRSTDAAKSWQVVEAGIWFNKPYKFLSTGLGNRIYAVNQNGTIYSDDFGNTWNNLNLPDWGLGAIALAEE